MSNAEEGTGDGDDNSTNASSNSSASTNDMGLQKRDQRWTKEGINRGKGVHKCQNRGNVI